MPEETTETPGAEPVRVLICDDHALFRRGLMMVLEETPGVEVVAEASHGSEAVAMAEDFAPDVVLMDVHMPGLDGIEATRRIAINHPSARIIMLTVGSDQAVLFEAIRVGATTNLSKETAIDGVAEVVRAVANGQVLLSPGLAAKLLQEFESMAAGALSAGAPLTPTLAPREVEVLQGVVDAKSNAAVAADLGISQNTVKNHLRNVLAKLHLHTWASATPGEAEGRPGR